MKVVLSVPGKFHTFDLARELHARAALSAIFTGYPHFKLRAEKLPREKIHSWPWLQSTYMAMPKRHWLGPKAVQEWEWRIKTSLDDVVARRMPPCDVFVGLSGSALRSGQRAHRLGARYVCDRGSSHIRTQNELLREESRRWGVAFEGIDPRVIEFEEAEYEQADCITVPSTFSVRSFVRAGVPAHKLKLLPYGVNLDLFKPVGLPDPKRFDVLYVGGMNLNKGIPYLLQAYAQLKHPQKSLTFAGAPSQSLIDRMKVHGLWPHDVKLLGHVPQPRLKELMSHSHVMVLASVQEGFGMVLSQAMACGCVVIATEHTGALDLYQDGQAGFIVPVRDGAAIADRMQMLADDPSRRMDMSQRAIQAVQGAGGWKDYGDAAMAVYQQLLEH
ncbi:MAG: glycosyltransferase family 1 protein [Burkholderiales bacterium]|jgi:starch synthase|nr:MAG: glycosyltransferase family 1 protein [Burkholderiales bacterium]